jgi:hypothetical protein
VLPRLGEPTRLIDELRASTHEPVARLDQHAVALCVGTPVHDRLEERRVDTAQSSE